MNIQGNLVFHIRQSHRHLSSPGMFVDIRQPFLQEAQQADLDLRLQRTGASRYGKGDGSSCLLPPAVSHPCHCIRQKAPSSGSGRKACTNRRVYQAQPGSLRLEQPVRTALSLLG
jgi:hypothetical protein